MGGEKAKGKDTHPASLSGTFLQRKDVVNQCLEFEGRSVDPDNAQFDV